jgi:hypothetical protein
MEFIILVDASVSQIRLGEVAPGKLQTLYAGIGTVPTINCSWFYSLLGYAAPQCLGNNLYGQQWVNYEPTSSKKLLLKPHKQSIK